LVREEVELVPSGLVTCLINEEEVRILKISPETLTLRLAEELNDKTFLKVAFYSFKEYKYNEVIIDDFQIENKIEEEFYFKYMIKVKDKHYAENVRRIVKDYYNYIMLKNYGAENEFSKEMVKYPAKLDYDFYKYFSNQKKEWLLNFDWKENVLENVEVAIKIDNHVLYNKYLELEFIRFKNYYLSENYMDNTIICNKEISRIYIGNEFCHNLFPKADMLMDILTKAKQEGLKVTLCFTYIRENYIENTKKVLEDVYEFCILNNLKIELVINDWGILDLLQGKEDVFDLSLGVLLNKRKKDPRYIYKKGYNENKELMAKNNLNNEVFSGYLAKYNIHRFEYESCGYKLEIANGKHSLQLPFYQTNTSQYCTLYAMCKNQDRGKQKLVKCCPKYCTDYVFAYPKHLNMVGRYNSLFAFDSSIIKDSKLVLEYINSGIDRLVLNFL